MSPAISPASCRSLWKSLFSALCAALALPVLIAGCHERGHYSSVHIAPEFSLVVTATSVVDRIDVPHAQYHYGDWSAGEDVTVVVVNDSTGIPARIETMTGSITVHPRVTPARGGTVTMTNFGRLRFGGSRRLDVHVSENRLVMVNTIDVVGGEKGTSITLYVEDAVVSINSSTTVTHNFKQHLHYDGVGDQLPDSGHSHFLLAEYMAFSYHNRLNIIYGHHGALTPKQVMSSLAAAAVKATYAIPPGGAKGGMLDGRIDRIHDAELHNSKLGELVADFANGVLTLNLTVDGHRFSHSAPVIMDFLEIIDFEMTIAGNTFHNKHCISAGGEHACSGKLEFKEAHFKAVNFTSSVYSPRDTAQMGGMFGGPNAEEAGGSFRYESRRSGNLDAGLILQFLAAGKGGRE